MLGKKVITLGNKDSKKVREFKLLIAKKNKLKVRVSKNKGNKK